MRLLNKGFYLILSERRAEKSIGVLEAICNKNDDKENKTLTYINLCMSVNMLQIIISLPYKKILQVYSNS